MKTQIVRRLISFVSHQSVASRRGASRSLAAGRNRKAEAWTSWLGCGVAFLLSLAAWPAAAADGDVDPDFNPPNASDDVATAVVQPDEKILIGGFFQSVGGVSRRFLARLNPDGTLDNGFNPEANNRVYSFTIQTDGKIIVGGEFTSIAGSGRGGLARLNPDGTLDAGFNPNVNDIFYCTAVQADGKIVVGGLYTTIRLNPDGTADPGFNAPALDNGWIYSTVVQADGKVLIGGNFTSVGGVTRNRIARLNADGTLDTGFNPDASGLVTSAAEQADGKILISGAFSSMGGMTRRGLARVLPDGTLDTTFIDPYLLFSVLGTAEQADGKILVWGSFTTTAPYRIARLNPDGTHDAGFNPSVNNNVYGAAMQADGRIMIGGEFTTVGGTARVKIARVLNGPATQTLSVTSAARIQWLRGGTAPEATQVSFDLSTDGTTWTALGVGTRISGGWELTGLGLPANGTIRARSRVIGGYFDGSSSLLEQQMVFSGLAVPEIRVEEDSSVMHIPHDTNLVDGTSSVDFDNLLVGSSGSVKTFTIINDGIADLTGLAITIDGTHSTDFTAGALGATTLAPHTSTTFAVTFRPAALFFRCAALHIVNNDFDETPFDVMLTGRGVSGGEVDVGFRPDADNTVVSVAVQPDGKIILGGSFGVVSGEPHIGIARLNADGTLDNGFNPSLDGPITSTSVQADGKIVIGGLFTTVGGMIRNNVARLESDGALDADFDPNVNDVVNCMAVQADGKILIGGRFNIVGGEAQSRIARLNVDGSLDIGFNASANQEVNCIAVQPDGKILIGGSFTEISGMTRNHVARLQPDGTLDTGFNPSTDSAIACLSVQADGKIVIGGYFSFSEVGTTGRNGIARLNADGTLDTGFNPNAERQSGVQSLALQSDGKIIVAGELSFPGGVFFRVGRVNTDGTLDTDFNSNVNRLVWGAALQADGKVVIGGEFSFVGWVIQPQIARLLNGPATQTLTVRSAVRVEWMRGGTAPEATQVTFELSTDGTTWTVLGPGTRIGGGWELTSLNLPASGTMRARARTTGGWQNGSSGLVEQQVSFSGLAVPEIAVEQPAGTDLLDGAASIDFGNVIPGSSSVAKTFTITNQGTADLTGLAITTDGSHPDDFAASAIGATTLAPGESATFTVTFSPTAIGSRGAVLHLASNDFDENPFDIAISGNGTPEGAVDTGFDPNANHIVIGIAVQPDGKLVLGGTFTSMGGTARNRIARLNANGTLDTGFDPDANNFIFSVVVQADGKIVIAGNFTNVGGTPRNRIARLNTDGSVDASFNPDVNASIWNTAVQPDGKIVIGGGFTSVGGTARHYVARVNPNGTLDPGFNPGPNYQVESVAVGPNGNIVIGGAFTMIGDTPCNWLAQLDSDGMLIPGFNPNPNGPVESIAFQADGKILIGGLFSMVGGLPRNRIARLNPVGTVDVDFDANANAPVYNIPLQADGMVVIGGYFTSVGGLTRNHIARLDSDGNLDLGFDPNVDDDIWGTAIQGDGRIIIGGDFTTVTGTPRNRVARLLNGPATQTLAVPNHSRLEWLRGGTAPEATHVTFELSTDGTTWIALGAGTRIPGGWELTGLSLPASGTIRARARITGGDRNGSSGLVESLQSYLIDLPPTLTTVTIASGNTNAAFAKPADVVTLDFTASEPIQTPTVIIAGKPATVTNPSGNQWSGTVTVAEGDPQGVVAFSIDFEDLAGNNGSQVTETTDASSVTIDTAAPVLTPPSNQSAEATGSSGATVHYPAATATDNFTASPTIGYSQASGTIFPLGTTTVTVTATDSAGNLATDTFAVLVTDTTPPTITILGANPASLVAGTVYTDEGATATDLVDGPLPVTPTSDVDTNIVGEYSVVYTATDAHSNTATATRTVIVMPNWPVMTTLYRKNGMVPGAGEAGSGIPAGATWKDFGVPTINDAGSVAVIGKWASSTECGTGIFVNDELAVKIGEPVPGINGVTWKSFLDPVLAEDGSIAFLAEIEGWHVSKSNDRVVARAGSSSPAMILARTGNTAPGTGGAKFGEFKALSIDGPSVAFAAKLAKGTGNPRVTTDNDDAVWASDPTNPLALVVRQGRTIWLSTGRATKLKSFDFLSETRGSPGMGRGYHAWDGTNTIVRFRAVLADRRSAQMTAVPGGTPVAISESGAGVGRPSISGATFRSYGLPASDHTGTRMAFLANLTNGSGGVTPANSQGIFLFNPTTSLFDAVARLGYPAPDIDGVFSAFDDPVFAADNSSLAWGGQAKGGTLTSTDDTGIWWQPDGEAAMLVVREGEEPSGVPGARWKSFDSLALPGAGHGPLFLASLVTGSGYHPGPGGVANDTNKGLWALDSTDTLQLLVRNGVTQIDGQTVKSFTALQAVEGLPGASRTFNSSATVVWRANFTGGGSAIIKTTVP